MNLLRSEQIIVRDGRSLLDVRGSGFDAVLLIEGKPLLYHWSDCHGSVGQYLVYSMAPDAIQEAFSFRNFLESTPEPGVPLTSQLASFLPALAPGAYRLSHHALQQAYDLVEFDDSWDYVQDSAQYYPGCGSFVMTQSSSSLSEERISDYEQRIKRGERPALLTASVENGWSNFVIDGHHKLIAYIRTGTPAHYLSVERINAPHISAADALNYIPTQHPLRKICEATKNQYDVS